jgi:hypothetical protein
MPYKRKTTGPTDAGRPSQGLTRSIYVRVTSEMETWVERHPNGAEYVRGLIARDMEAAKINSPQLPKTY